MDSLATHPSAPTAEILVKDERVTVLRHAKGSVHLLGTHHNRANSAVAVRELIGSVRPHIVAVELCRTNLERYNQLNDDGPLPAGEQFASKRSYMDVVPSRLKDRAIGEELLLGLVVESLRYDRLCVYRNRLKRLTCPHQHHHQQQQQPPSPRRFRVRPKLFHDVLVGREMTAPFRRAVWSLEKPTSAYLVNKAAGYKIMLADKPVEETFRSVAAALSADERALVQVYQANFLRLFVASSAGKTIMMDMIERNAKLHDAIVGQRDQHMARSLRKALDDADARHPEKTRVVGVVGVVGKQHVAGIVKYWYAVICRSNRVRLSTRTRTRMKRRAVGRGRK